MPNQKVNFQTSQKNKKMKSNFVDNTKMDLSFDGSMLDESISNATGSGNNADSYLNSFIGKDVVLKKGSNIINGLALYSKASNGYLYSQNTATVGSSKKVVSIEKLKRNPADSFKAYFKFSDNTYSLALTNKKSGIFWEKTSSFNGGALEDGDFNGGDTFAFNGVLSTEQIKAINEAKSIEEEYKKLNSKDKSVVSFEDYYKYKIYKKNGGKKDYKEWYKTERLKSSATDVLKTLGQFSSAYLEQKGYKPSTDDTSLKKGDFENKDYSEKDNTILGMHPVTFGVVSVVVAAVGIGAVIYFKNK